MSARREHAPDGTRVGVVALALGGVAVGLGVAALVAYLLAVPPADRDTAPAGPRDEPDFAHAAAWIRAERAARARADVEWLTTYGWVDREARVIHVPLERAVELVLAEGLAVEPAPGRAGERDGGSGGGGDATADEVGR